MKFELKSVIRWFDSGYHPTEYDNAEDQVDLARCISMIILHIGCFGVIWVGWSWFAVSLAVVLYFTRMFAITGFLHRYFSHRTFKANRLMQFIFAVLASTAVQRGPLWWASHHRKHHQESDTEDDVHSPHADGFLWSHIGWITSTKNFSTDNKRVRDFARYPELVFLDRFDVLVPLLMAGGLYFMGEWAGMTWPSLATTGPQLLVWGFFVSTTILFHGTSTINSMAHIFGNQRFNTGDKSKNNFWLALITLGEGWHNNHHYYMHSARQGFYWWEIDPTYYGLRLMSWLGMIHDLKPVPQRVLEQGRNK